MRGPANLPRLDSGLLMGSTWPGCYPIAYITSEAGTICPLCANTIDSDHSDPETITAAIAPGATCEDQRLECDVCAALISEGPEADDPASP